jgi:pimeloyl-ACP methyl ester carboxylesterase
VDWHNLAPGPWYPSAARNVVPVGTELARLIDRLVSVGAIRIDTLHLVGFSLGAHVVAIAANRLTSGRVPRITGTIKFMT